MILKVCGLSIILILTGRLSLFLFGTEEGVAYIWLPAGAAFVTLVFIKRSLWPGITIGSFITNVTFGLPIFTSIGIAFGSTIGALAGVYALQFAAFTKDPERIKNAVKFNGLGATVSAAVSAVGGITALHLTGIIPQEALLGNGWRWWIGDTIGIILVGALAWMFFNVVQPGGAQGDASPMKEKDSPI